MSAPVSGLMGQIRSRGAWPGDQGRRASREGCAARARRTHAGRHVPPRGRQQLQGRADAGEQLGARQAAQHVLGVGEAAGHLAEQRTGLRAPGGS